MASSLIIPRSLLAALIVLAYSLLARVVRLRSTDWSRTRSEANMAAARLPTKLPAAPALLERVGADSDATLLTVEAMLTEDALLTTESLVGFLEAVFLVAEAEPLDENNEQDMTPDLPFHKPLIHPPQEHLPFTPVPELQTS